MTHCLGPDEQNVNDWSPLGGRRQARSCVLSERAAQGESRSRARADHGDSRQGQAVARWGAGSVVTCPGTTSSRTHGAV